MTVKRDTHVAILFGGRSAEHEVSLRSAAFVNDAIHAAGFQTTLIAIGRDGKWRLAPDIASPHPDWPEVAILPGSKGQITRSDGQPAPEPVNVVFPVLHSPYGEDGTVQGLLNLADVAFVGPGVLASAASMDKDATKQLLRASGIPVVDSMCFGRANIPTFSSVSQTLGTPVFVKPCNMGSSIGVSKAHDEADYLRAVDAALRFDARVLVERNAEGQELECAVMSTPDGLAASSVAEIIATSNSGFYDYASKYETDDGATLQAPAKIPSEVNEKIREVSLAVARTLNVEGMARVDFFLKADGNLLVNEVNTIPGFTSISMFPVLWKLSGVEAVDLVTSLLQHGIDRHHHETGLETRRGI